MFRRKNPYLTAAGLLCIFLALWFVYQNRTVSLNVLCPALRDGDYQTTFYWGQKSHSILGLDDRFREAFETAVVTPGKETASLPHLCFEFRVSKNGEQHVVTVGADDSVTIAKAGDLDERTYWQDPTGTLFAKLYPTDQESGTGIVPGYRPDGQYDAISFADFPYSEVNSLSIYNGHTGKTTYINDSDSVSSICDFLSNVSGRIGQSSIGYYDHLQTLTLYRNESAAAAILAEEPPVLEITFGHNYFVYYGEYGDGYPIRYTLDGINCEDVFLYLQPYETEYSEVMP